MKSPTRAGWRKCNLALPTIKLSHVFFLVNVDDRAGASVVQSTSTSSRIMTGFNAAAAIIIL
jgi:hypothetical protein